MKAGIVSCIVGIFVWCGMSYGAMQNDFVLTVLKDDNPVREFNGQVNVPFNSEYKLRIKNNHPRRCICTVFIDGVKVSEMGGFVINGNDKLDLERFLNGSLAEGQRFKFVSLFDPNVDDPSRAENGVIKIECKLEKIKENHAKGIIFFAGDVPFSNPSVLVTTSGSNSITIDSSFVTDSNNSILCSSAGATIPGSYSNQSFYEVAFDSEEEATVICLKMVGI